MWGSEVVKACGVNTSVTLNQEPVATSVKIIFWSKTSSLHTIGSPTQARQTNKQSKSFGGRLWKSLTTSFPPSRAIKTNNGKRNTSLWNP